MMKRRRTRNLLCLTIVFIAASFYFATVQCQDECVDDYCKNEGKCRQVSQFLFPRSSYRCEAQWAEYKNQCFRIFWRTTSWEEAKSICEQNKGNLYSWSETTDSSLNDLFGSIMPVLYPGPVREKLNMWTNKCDNSSVCRYVTQQSDYATTDFFNPNTSDSAVPLCFTHMENGGEPPIKQCQCLIGLEQKIGLTCEEDHTYINVGDYFLCPERDNNLSCPSSLKLRIDFASYDSFKEDLSCEDLQQLNPEGHPAIQSGCSPSNALFLLKYWCQGKRYCPLNNIMFQNVTYLTTDKSCGTKYMRIRRYCYNSSEIETDNKCAKGDYLVNETNSETCLKPIYSDLNWWSALEWCRRIGGNLAFLPNDTSEIQRLLQLINPLEYLHALQVKIWIKSTALTYSLQDSEDYQTCTHLILDMEKNVLKAVKGQQHLPCDIQTKHYWLCKFFPESGKDCPHNATKILLLYNTETCYLLGQEKLMYGEARAKCEKMNGSLASYYEDKHPQNQNFSTFLKTSLITASQDYWIAGIANEYRPVNGTFNPCSRITKNVSSTSDTKPVADRCSLNNVRNAICAYPPSDYPKESNKSRPLPYMSEQKKTDPHPILTSQTNKTSFTKSYSSYSTDTNASKSKTNISKHVSITQKTTPVIDLKGFHKRLNSNITPSRSTPSSLLPLTNFTSALPNISENASVYSFSDPPNTFPQEITSVSPNTTVEFTTVTSTIDQSTTTSTSQPTSDRTTTPSRRPVLNCGRRDLKDLRGHLMVWNATTGNTYQYQNCPGGALGKARWFCNGTTGLFHPLDWPDLSDCHYQITADFHEQLHAGAQPHAVAQNILDALKDPLYGGDLQKIIEILPLMNSKQDKIYETYPPEVRESMAVTFTDSMADIFNMVLNEAHVSAWMDIPEETRCNVSTHLLLSVDETGFMLAAKLNQTSQMFVKQNLNMFVVRPLKPILQSNLIRYPLQTKQSESHIILPKYALKKAEKGTVFINYNNLSVLLPTSSYRGLEPINSSFGLNSEVLGASVKKAIRIPDGEFVEVIFKHKLPLKNATDAVCVYWNTTNQGYWDDTGCTVNVTNSTHTICICNHLTNFAVLMDLQNVLAVKNDHVEALKWITVIGCTISIICLALSCLIFISFRSLWNLRNAIHCNLCISLLVSQIVLLIGLDRTESKVGCGFVAGLLHFSWLAAFVWMAGEGVMIYILLIKVFETGEQKAWHYYIAGYGIPAIIVIVSASCRWEGYGTPNYCWLSTEDGLIFAFAGPLAVIIIFNLIMLALALRAAASVKLQRHQSKVEVARLWIKRAVSLVPLLGLSWIFGFLYINNYTIVFAYLFTIFNSIQGIFIFVIHCLRNEKVQQVLSRYIAKKRERLDSLTFSGKSSRSNSCTVTSSTLRSGSGSASSDTPPSSGKKPPTNRPSHGLFPRTRVAPSIWRYKLDITTNSISIDPNNEYDVTEPNANFKMDPFAIIEPTEDNSKVANGVFFRVRSASDVSV